ncbi:MAG TPA: hypothetical protein VFO52_09815 [Longimicrobiales bacterium]|nr:hypothetical protein [Longimicrobiales bacterium]
MAQHPINNKHGKATEYFWTDKHAADPEKATVFRKTEEGVKKMTGVHFDTKSGRLVKE